MEDKPKGGRAESQRHHVSQRQAWGPDRGYDTAHRGYDTAQELVHRLSGSETHHRHVLDVLLVRGALWPLGALPEPPHAVEVWRVLAEEVEGVQG